MNGGKTVSVPLTPEYQSLTTAANKLQALREGGYLIHVDSVAQTITIHLNNFTPTSAKSAGKDPVAVAVPKIDPNVPFSDYVVPKFLADAIAIITAPKTSNLWFYGPTQCGKTRAVHYIGYKLGRKIHKINCRGDMDSSHVFGRNTVVIETRTDKNGLETHQNVVKFVPGIAEKAMTEGLNEKGEVVGPAGILFIDEAASMPTEVGIGLNHMLETVSNIREITIAEDGNRLVKSHPEFRVILAGNTNGTGANDMASQMYTAQQCALDASMSQRITSIFRFGYDRTAEEMIVRRGCDNDSVISIFLTFKQSVRDAIRRGECSTPFSTKRVIDVFDLYTVFVTAMQSGSKANLGKTALSKAIYYASFELLRAEEQAKYDELFNAVANMKLSQWSPCNDVTAKTDFL